MQRRKQHRIVDLAADAAPLLRMRKQMMRKLMLLVLLLVLVSLVDVVVVMNDCTDDMRMNERRIR